MATNSKKLQQESEELYERYGRPSEAEHWGEFVAIAPTGKTIVRPTLIDVAEQALASFGPGSFVFKIGEKSVGRIR